jgi:hypothetical protein
MNRKEHIFIITKYIHIMITVNAMPGPGFLCTPFYLIN